jgi:iron(III)-enterobactin esterase
MNTNIYFSFIYQFLLITSIVGCKQNTNQTGIPPVISSIEWTEISDTSATILVVEKDIANFQSTNLGNLRTLRILMPDYYEDDSVKVKLNIEMTDSLNEISDYFCSINNGTYNQLPENKIITLQNGINTLDVYAINNYEQKSDVFSVSDLKINIDYKVLYSNDGQDFTALNFKNILNNLYTNNSIEKIIVVGIDASADRLNEYGTIDSLGTTIKCYSSIGEIGTKAAEYTRFLIDEVIPYINLNYRVKTGPENTTIMGSSLGGLSAFDIAWMKPYIFGKAGAFSGSFWWREYSGPNPTGEEINQARIMHKLVKNSFKRNGMKFWFEAGTNDETSDRDGDGIIDAVDDTKDLILELDTLKYIENQDIVYLEVQGGQHNQTTWSKVLDDFLIWNYKK